MSKDMSSGQANGEKVVSDGIGEADADVDFDDRRDVNRGKIP